MADEKQYSTGPPPYHAHPPPPMMTATVLVAAPGKPVGPDPMPTRCPSCNQQIVTRTERKATTKTHVIACILFLFICWPCVCLPYCMDSCNNINHYCPNCSAYIGGYTS